MKKQIRKLNDEELASYPIRGLAEGWFFRVSEISQGFYEVEAIDRWGRKVSRTGIDPEKLFALCKDDVDAILRTMTEKPEKPS